MLRKTLVLLAPVLLAAIFQTRLQAEVQPPATQWLPPDAAIVVEVTQPKVLLDPLLGQELANSLTALSEGRKPNAKLQQLQAFVAYVELQANTDWRTGVRNLLNKGFTFATEPDGGILLCLDAQDEKLALKLHDVFHLSAARAVSREYRGATAWTFSPNEAHAIIGDRVLLANRPEVLNHALDQRAEAKGPNFAESPFYQAARKALGQDTAATVFVNLKVLRLNPGIQQALTKDSNPMGTLLLPDAKAALRTGNWLALGISVKNDKLSLKFVTDGQVPVKEASFVSPPGEDEGIMPNLTVPGGIASLSLFRDLHGFYASKDELFSERTSGLIFFENMMGIFFSGMELTDGVMGQARSDIRVVVAAQQYDSAIGTPAVQVPAFAAVLRLRHPEQFGDVVEEAWQKALGLSNFTRGQKALPGLIIDRTTHADVKYTLSYYRPPKDGDKAAIDARFNYRPSLARPGDYLIFSSTDKLAEDLIDVLKREGAAAVKPSKAAHSLLELNGAQLRTALLANRENLIRNDMVEKGDVREQAEGNIDVLLTVLDSVDHLKLSMSRDQDRPQMDLELKLKLPGNKPEKTTAMK